MSTIARLSAAARKRIVLPGPKRPPLVSISAAVRTRLPTSNTDVAPAMMPPGL
jgi:hypothetical protein